MYVYVCVLTCWYLHQPPQSIDQSTYTTLTKDDPSSASESEIPSSPPPPPPPAAPAVAGFCAPRTMRTSSFSKSRREGRDSCCICFFGGRGCGRGW